MKLILLIATSVFAATTAHADFKKVDAAWKARGEQAKKQYEKLSKIKSPSDAELCEMKLEAAFSDYANSKLAKELVKESGGNRMHALKIQTGDPKAANGEALLLGAMYDSSGEQKQTQILKLANGWISMVPPEAGVLTLLSEKCTYMISTRSLLESKALELKLM